MIDLFALATTAIPTMPVVNTPYPWGTSAADEMLVYVIWDLGRRVISAHYDDERKRMIDALQPSDDAA